MRASVILKIDDVRTGIVNIVKTKPINLDEAFQRLLFCAKFSRYFHDDTILFTFVALGLTQPTKI